MNGGQSEIIEDGINGFLFDINYPSSFHEKLDIILSLSKKEISNIQKDAIRTTEKRRFYDEIYDREINLFKKAINKESTYPRKYPVLKYKHQLKKYVSPSTDVTFKRALLSIVIPYYNLGDYIEETLISVLNNNYENTEIIIVDDGSNLEHKAVLKRLNKRYEFTIKTKDNEGLPSARNFGAIHSSGEFLAFLDTDDTVESDYYSRAIKLFGIYDNISFIGCFVQYFEGSLRRWITWDPEFPYALVHNMLNTSGLVYRRRDFLNGGLNDEDMKYGMEDYESMISMMESGFYGISIPQLKFNYRVRKDSISRKFNHANQQYLYELIVKKHEKLFQYYARDIVNILNQNGPGYMYSNPTFKSFLWKVDKDIKESSSFFRLRKIFSRIIRKPYKLISYPYKALITSFREQ